MLNVFVPGKIILTGEHAVVAGKLALSVSITRGVTIRVVSGDMVEYPEDSMGLINKAIELAGGDKSVCVEIESELPVGAGLGSSAAVSAATIKGVREYLGNPISDDELFELTMECEKLAHGNPSGIDPAAVIYQGLIAYVKNSPIEKLKLEKSLQILVVSSGTPSESTKEMVELVAGGDRYPEIVRKIGKITREIRERLMRGEEIVKLINENGILLESLGVVGESAKQLGDELRDGIWSEDYGSWGSQGWIWDDDRDGG
jgi:mevalonate kinase